MVELIRELPKRYFSIALLCLLAGFVLLPSSKAVNNFYYGFLALPAIFLLLTGRVRWLKSRANVIAWLVFLFWLAATGWIGADEGFYKHLLYVSLFCVIVAQLADPDVFDHPLVLRAFFWGLVVYVMLSVAWLWAQGHYFPGLRIVDLPGRLSGPILTSMLMVGCYALLVPLWWRNKNGFEAAFGLGCMLFCIGFVLQSRSGLVGLVALFGAVGFWVLIFGSSRARITYCLGGIGLSLVSVWLFFGTDLGAGLVDREDSGRFSLWLDYLRQWSDCGWWLGCGYGYGEVVANVNGEEILHPHNIYLAMGFYGGLMSMLLLVVALGLTFITAFHQKNPWGLFLLLSAIMLSFDGHKLIDSPSELWLLVWLPAMLIISRSGRESGFGTVNALSAR